MKAQVHIPAVTSGCHLRSVSLAVSSSVSFLLMGVPPDKDANFVILSTLCIWGAAE